MGLKDPTEVETIDFNLLKIIEPLYVYGREVLLFYITEREKSFKVVEEVDT